MGAAGGIKRFQNSSRAPSKHVDDYQPAPVVRKTVPAEPAHKPGGDMQAQDGELMRDGGAGCAKRGHCGPNAWFNWYVLPEHAIASAATW